MMPSEQMSSVNGRIVSRVNDRIAMDMPMGGGGGAGGGTAATPPTGGGGGAAETDSQTTPSANWWSQGMRLAT
eukprot:4960182-Prymnesium_polylepis.1